MGFDVKMDWEASPLLFWKSGFQRLECPANETDSDEKENLPLVQGLYQVLLSVTVVDCRPVPCMSIRLYSGIGTQFMSPERTDVCVRCDDMWTRWIFSRL